MVKSTVLSIGEKIAFFRKQKKLSQEDLALLLGKSRTTITMYESSKIEPTVTVLHEIARALEITVFDLLLDAEEDQDRFLTQPLHHGIPHVEELKNKIKHLEGELNILKRELVDKAKIIALHEKREADYENRLKDIQELYAKIIKRLP